MRRLLAVALLFSFSPVLIAAPYDEMDYGPFLSHTFQLPNNNITLRGIAVPFDAPIEGDVITPGAIRSLALAALESRNSPDLDFSNRPLRTRTPGGVGGVRSAMSAALSR